MRNTRSPRSHHGARKGKHRAAHAAHGHKAHRAKKVSAAHKGAHKKV